MNEPRPRISDGLLALIAVLGLAICIYLASISRPPPKNCPCTPTCACPKW